MSTGLMNNLILVASIGGVIALNLIIAGLVVIAVIHDGNTAQQVATTFETALTAAITAIGTLVGSLVTGKIVHAATMSAQIPAPNQEAGK